MHAGNLNGMHPSPTHVSHVLGNAPMLIKLAQSNLHALYKHVAFACF